MKTPYFSRLSILLFFGFLLLNSLSAQHWIGLHNLNYQNKSDVFESTTTSPSGATILTTQRYYQKALAAGVHYRLLGENDVYQQFELRFTRSTVGESTRVEVQGIPIVEPTRGQETTDTRVSVGYRRGKLYTLKERLRADIGAGVLAGWANNVTLPLTSANFPLRQSGVSFTINVYTGLNYQLHPRVNIGYDIIPVAFDGFAYEQTLENPILTERQQKSSGMDIDIVTFPEIVGWQNFRISYVLE